MNNLDLELRELTYQPSRRYLSRFSSPTVHDVTITVIVEVVARKENEENHTASYVSAEELKGTV